MSEFNWIDDAFRVYKTKYGVWHSCTKENKELITALTEDQCINATRFYLKGLQDGWGETNSRVVNDGVVGGKL
jgi:hypothetical protein